MYRASARFFGIVLGIACLSYASSVQAQTSAPQPMGVGDVRAIFTNAGYQVGQTYAWDWTSPPVNSFQVRDPNSDRVLMALVYADQAGADTARAQAAAQDHTSGDAAMPNSVGPRLVPGFGRSLWNGNVALVQTTEAELIREYQSRTDRTSGMDGEQLGLDAPALVNASVDLDFQLALIAGAVNL